MQFYFLPHSVIDIGSPLAATTTSDELNLSEESRIIPFDVMCVVAPESGYYTDTAFADGELVL